MVVIDLKPIPLRHHPACGCNTSRQELPYGHRQAGFLSSHRSSSLAYVSAVREALSGKPQGQVILLPRPVSLHGFCSTDVSRKSARYRSLPSRPEQQALSHGHPQSGVEKYSRQRQQGARLANLCGPGSQPHSSDAQPLPERGLWYRTRPDRLCSRCNDNRSVPDAVSVGRVSADQERHQAAHLLDLRGSIPTFIYISDGKEHEVTVLDDLPLEAGAIYVMDRGYLDYFRLYRMTKAHAFFVIRAKKNMAFRRLYSAPVNREVGLLCDQTIVLTGYYAARDYPEKLRRVRVRDLETDKTIVILSNNFTLPAESIALLYRRRWYIEQFFRWIKQNLRIKAFYGTSENAVKTQIWIAVTVYLLVAIMKKRLKIEASLYTILQILSVTSFERIQLNQLLVDADYATTSIEKDNQLFLFN